MTAAPAPEPPHALPAAAIAPAAIPAPPGGRVFGIGWAKTGTTTLGACLHRLGYRHCSQRLELVQPLVAGNPAPLLAVAASAESFEDWPWPLAFRELDAAFPGSRFVLTVREPLRWLASYQGMLARQGPAGDDLNAVRSLIHQVRFPDPDPMGLLARYERHNLAVQRHFARRRERLLVVDWERGDGWLQLCRFLGRPVPAVPLPHANRGRYDTDQPLA